MLPRRDFYHMLQSKEEEMRCTLRGSEYNDAKNVYDSRYSGSLEVSHDTTGR
jgi:hypothetical protein